MKLGSFRLSVVGEWVAGEDSQERLIAKVGLTRGSG